MLAQLLVGPWSTGQQIGIPLTIIVLVIEGTLGGAILGPGVSRAGTIGPPEYATVAVCGAMVIPFFVLFLRTTIFDVWEARFWHMPWSDSTPVAPGEPCRKSAPFVGQPCPFTGKPPTMRCSCCKAAVHKSAYNHIEKKTTFVVGESVMRWGVATQALEKQDKPAIARIELDEALDFNGNIFWGAMGNCCIGCATWHRCFNLMPRWSLTCAFMSMAFVAAPWAFQSSLLTVNNGKSLQWWMLLQAQGLAICALAVELRRLSLATAFMTRFTPQIPFVNPILIPDSGWKRFAVRMAAGEAAWRGIQEPEGPDAQGALEDPQMRRSGLGPQSTE